MDGKQQKQVTNAMDGAKNNDSAKTALQQAVESKEEGNAYLRKHNYVQAIECYDKAIRICPLNNKVELAIFFQNRAAANEKLKNWIAMKEDCNRSLEHNPSYVNAYKRRAKAYKACGELQDAIDDAAAVCVLEEFDVRSSIDYLYDILKQSASKEAEDFVKTSKAILPSVAYIKNFIAETVQDPVLNEELPESVVKALTLRGYVRAKLSLKARNYEDVIPACSEELHPTQPVAKYEMEALLLRGTFYFLQFALKEAEEDFVAIISNVNASKKMRAYAYMRRAKILSKLNQKTHALIDLDKAERLWPISPDIFYHRAHIYFELDMYPAAIAQHDKALELASDHVNAYIKKLNAEYHYALSAQNSLRVSECEQNIKNSIVKFPNIIVSHIMLAQILTAQKKFKQADRCYLKALELDPNNALIYMLRAGSQVQLKQIKKGVSLLKHAIVLDPRCYSAYMELSKLEVDRGNFEHAVKIFESALNVAIRYDDCMHLFRLRNFAQALINLKNKFKIKAPNVAGFGVNRVFLTLYNL